MKEVLQNTKCSAEYDPERKEIFGQDKTDHYNDPAFYSKTKRGIKAAWEEIKAKFTPETTMHDLLEICQAHNIRTHYWCMVD